MARKLADVIPPDVLAQDIADGYIRRRTHPGISISIYTYTEACTYAEHWTEATRLCRGLIVDDAFGEIIAWPFPKFWNYHDHVNGKPYAPPLPTDEPFEVYDKVDGSLGIVFHYRGHWQVATKGSFESEQAKWARRWIDDRDAGAFLTPGWTYLTEITYPENRIVVRNEGPGTLTLLGVYDSDGTEVPLDRAQDGWELTGGDIVLPYPSGTLADVVQAAADSRDPVTGEPLPGNEAEGWVIRFASGLRVKVKTADYVRLHGVLSRTSPRTIWEALAAGNDPATLLDTVPDEFRDWVQQTADDLRARYTAWIAQAEADYLGVNFHLSVIGVRDRKTFAEHAVRSPYKAALFRLLDGRDITELAWRAVKPEPSLIDAMPSPWAPGEG